MGLIVLQDQVQALLYRSDHLTELPNANLMARNQDTLTAELKGLKAAYRTAIGSSRKNPKRSKKQNKGQDVDDSEGAQKENEGANAQRDSNSLSGTAQLIQEIREGTNIHFNQLSI